MASVFCPPRYTGTFITVHFISPEWGWQVTLWECGRARGHKWYERIFDAALDIASSGYIWAGDEMKNLFEQDVVLGGI